MTTAGEAQRHVVLRRLADAREGVGTALAGTAWSASDDDLLAALDAAVALSRQVEAEILALTREADLRDLRCRFGQVDTRGLLRHRYGIGAFDARDLVALARVLDGSHPATFSAMADGRISSRHAEVIAESLAELPPSTAPSEALEAERILIEHAPTLEPSELRICGRAIAEKLARTPDVDDPDEAARVAAEADESAARLFARRSLSSRRDPRTGLRRISMLVDDETHSALFATLDPLALPHPTLDGVSDARTLSQRRVDALAELVDVALRADLLPMTGGGMKPQLVVTIDWETLTGSRYRAAVLDDGGDLSPSALRRMLCDGDVLPAVLGGESEILDLGRRARRHSTAQRRALGLRDRGCVFPGCDRVPSRCHSHHLKPWSEHGGTSVDNGALLCHHHHRRVHTEGWRVRIGSGGFPELEPPAWLDPSRRPRLHPRFLEIRRH
jgi:hypothetical protein